MLLRVQFLLPAETGNPPTEQIRIHAWHNLEAPLLSPALLCSSGMDPGRVTAAPAPSCQPRSCGSGECALSGLGEAEPAACVCVWVARGYFGKEREGGFVLLPLVITRSKQESCLCSWTPGEANQPLAPPGPVGL